MISSVDWLDLATPGKLIDKNTCETNNETPVIENIQKEVEKLEKIVVNDFYTQTMPQNVLKFLRVVIDSFSKVFRLWYENPVLKNSIETEVFYNIFSLMFQSFNSEIKEKDNNDETKDYSGLLAFCDICDQEFPINNNDVQSSYAEHAQTSIHIETENIFHMIGRPKEAGEEELNKRSTARQHKQSESSPMKRDNNKCIEADSKDPTKYLCHLCKYTLDKDMISKHKNGEWHRYQERLVDECYHILEENRYVVELIDDRTFDFECYLCDFKYRGFTRLIEHCKSKVHIDNKTKFSRNSSPVKIRNHIAPVENFVYRVTTKEWHCALCKHSFGKMEQYKHIEQQSHKNLEKLATRLLRVDKPFIYTRSSKSKSCVCSLCDLEIATMEDIIPHCQTEAHTKTKSKANEFQFLLKNYFKKEYDRKRFFVRSQTTSQKKVFPNPNSLK